MLSKTKLLALVREYQNKTSKTKLYFCLSTALRLIANKEPIEVFVLSFGERPVLPAGVISKHLPINVERFSSRQPFRLDTLLVSVKPAGESYEIVDTKNALVDVISGVVSTVEDPYNVMDERPFLAIRAAALIGETGFTPVDDLIQAVRINAFRLKYIDRKLIWRELCRLLLSDTPSAGIEFLRITGVLAIILPEVEACFGIQQNTRYHKYTVYEHCLKACDSCVNTDPLLRLAALIHDVGKPETVGRNENGITFHKHEVVSTKMAKNIVVRMGLKKTEADFVVSLVSNHMYQYDRVWKDATIRKFINRVGLTKEYVGRMGEFPLFQLRHADRMGRGLDPLTQKQNDFEKRLEETLNQP
jgi:tRNA nucleotidyltransferase (CCA-adding enzyme)